MSKAADAFRTISEVAGDLDIPKHVLRFWENRFPQIKPMKRGGGRRYYRPADLELLRGIRHLLHNEGYTIKGVQKILREQGVEAVKNSCSPDQQGKSHAPSRIAAAIEHTRAAPAARNRDLSKPRSTKAGAKKAASGKTGAKAAVTLAAIIGELQACRAMLTGEAEEKAPRKRARKRA